MTRYDAYEVNPVVEYQSEAGEAVISQVYFTQEEAESALNDGTYSPKLQRVIWTLFGHIDGEGVEAIGDFADEAEAFERLYRIAGIQGVSGQTIYPLSLRDAEPITIDVRIESRGKLLWFFGARV